MIDWFDLAYYIVCFSLLVAVVVGVGWLVWKILKSVLKK